MPSMSGPSNALDDLSEEFGRVHTKLDRIDAGLERMETCTGLIEQ